MERQQATLETIREKYHHSDTQCRYWEMQKKKYQKEKSNALQGIIGCSISSLYFISISSSNFQVNFILLIACALMVAVLFFRYNRFVEKRDICERAIVVWKFVINREYRDLFGRAEQGGIVYQDEVQRLEKDEKDISAQVEPIAADDKNFEQAKAETQKFFNLSTNPS